MNIYHIKSESPYFKYSEFCPEEMLDTRLKEIKNYYDAIHKVMKTPGAKLNVNHQLHNPQLF